MRYVVFLVVGIFQILNAQAQSGLFPLPKNLEPNVRFWVAMYTQYSASQYLFFDSGNVSRIYTILDMKKLELPSKKKDAVLGAEKGKLVSILKRLGQKEVSARDWSREEQRLASLFGDSAKPEDFQKAAERVRIQHGNKEQFREGLVRSGLYLDSLRTIFVQNGLPEALVYLPHVESSFNPRAGSKAGAVGIWQFIRPTGKKYLRIDDGIDERRDPYLSTRAAARLLKLSYDSLKSWPLAITAYNHGLFGIKKIAKELGTKDLGEMVAKYESKQFGFASKNFYAEFLASVHVAQHSSLYFDGMVMDSCWQFKTVELPRDMHAGSVKRAFHLSDGMLAELNPSLNKSILEDKNPMPLGFLLRVPAGADEKAAFEAWVSEGLLPRGAYFAWCRGMEKTLFRYVNTLYFYFPAGKDKRG